MWFSFSLQQAARFLIIFFLFALKPVLCLWLYKIQLFSKNLCCNCYSNYLPTGSNILTINLSRQNKSLSLTVISQLHCSKPSTCPRPFKLAFRWWILEHCSMWLANKGLDLKYLKLSHLIRQTILVLIYFLLKLTLSLRKHSHTAG